MKKTKSNNKFKSKCISIINKILIVAVLCLIVLIMCKKDQKVKNYIYDKVYNTNFKFNYFTNIYNKYLGDIIPLKKIIKEETVFNEELSYKKISKYKDGIKLEVSDNYMVPVIESGVVVFNNNKDGYGKTIIIQQVNGVDVWYCNVNSDIDVYDYVEKGSLLGESINNYIYLVFEKDGKKVDYKKYI